jgi:cell fate regulator YaaT (PSP1 superfamily)
MDKQLELHIDRYFSFDRKGSSTTSDQHHPPLSSSEAAALISVPSRKLYFVQFKGGRLDVFFIPENSNLTVLVNDLVIVDADRGRDLGRVVKDHVTLEEAGMLKYRRHQEQKAILQHNPNAASGSASGSTPPVTMPKQILRYAQLSEIHQIITKEANEDKAVAMCMHKVEEKGLNMSVIDAEYQWDGRKLTFFYSASHRIDFRDLVRELFRIYKTRIWMCAVNSSADAPLPLPPTPVVSSGASHQTASPSTSTLQSADSSDHDTAASPQLQNPHYEYGIVASQLLGGPPRPQQRPFYRMAEGWGPMMPPIPPPTGAYNPASGVPMFPQQAPPPGPGVAPPRKITGGHPPPSYGYPTFPQPFAQPQSEQAATSGQYWYGMPPPSQPFY